MDSHRHFHLRADVPPPLIRSALQFARHSPRVSSYGIMSSKCDDSAQISRVQLTAPLYYKRMRQTPSTSQASASRGGPSPVIQALLQQQPLLLPAADELEQSHLSAGDELAAAQIPPAAAVVPAPGGVTPAQRAVWRRTVADLEKLGVLAPAAAIVITDDPALATRLPPIAMRTPMTPRAAMPRAPIGSCDRARRVRTFSAQDSARRRDPRQLPSGGGTYANAAPPSVTQAGATERAFIVAAVLAATSSERALAGAVAASVLPSRCLVVGSATGAGGGAAAPLLRRRVQFNNEVAAAASGMVDAFAGKDRDPLEPPSASEISLVDCPPTTEDSNDEVFTTTTEADTARLARSSVGGKGDEEGPADWFWGRRHEDLATCDASLDSVVSADSTPMADGNVEQQTKQFDVVAAVSGRTSGSAGRPPVGSQPPRRDHHTEIAPIGLDGRDLAVVVDPLLTAPWVANPHDAADQGHRGAAPHMRVLPFTPRPPPATPRPPRPPTRTNGHV